MTAERNWLSANIYAARCLLRRLATTYRSSIHPSATWNWTKGRQANRHDNCFHIRTFFLVHRLMLKLPGGLGSPPVWRNSGDDVYRSAIEKSTEIRCGCHHCQVVLSSNSTANSFLLRSPSELHRDTNKHPSLSVLTILTGALKDSAIEPPRSLPMIMGDICWYSASQLVWEAGL